MPRTIRLQSDSNAHDRPWRVAVEQGFFAAEGLKVPDEFKEKVDWMMERGFLDKAPDYAEVVRSE